MADISPEQQERFNQFIQSISNASGEMNPLAATTKNTAEQAKAAGEKYKELAAGLKVAGIQIAKSAITVSDGIGKYSASVEKATETVADFASKLGNLGKVAGFLINIFGKLAGASLRQNEQLVKTYRQLAEFGDIDNSNFEQIMLDLQRAGFSIDQNAEVYVNAIKKSSVGLAAFAGSASEGRKLLLNTFSGFERNEQYLERLGITSDEAFERTGSFIAQLSMAGGMRIKDEKLLQQESKKYLETLVGLAAITGETRDAAEAARKEQQTDFRFQLYLNKLKLEDATRTQNMIQGISLTMGPMFAKGAKSILVNQGKIVDEAGAALYQLIGNEGITNLFGAINSGGDEIDAIVKMLQSNAPVIRERLTQLEQAFLVDPNLGPEFAATVELLKGLTTSEALDQKKLNELRQKLRNDAIKSDMDDNTSRKQAERMLRNAYEQLTNEIGKGLVPLITDLMNVFSKLGAVTADYLFTLSRGTVDFRNVFVDISTFSNAINTLAAEEKRQIDLAEKRKKLEEEILENTKKRNEILEKETKAGATAKQLEARSIVPTQRIEQLRKQLADIDSEMTRSKSISQRAAHARDVLGSKAGGGRGTIVPPSVNPDNQKTDAEILQSLNLKSSEAVAGGSATSELLQLANKINNTYPGVRFTALNDLHHHKHNPNSKHTIGKALDFTLPEGMAPKNAEEGAAIVSQLKSLGAYDAVDKYTKKSGTGPHFHVEVARYGGMFRGPDSGYPVMLHGKNESAWPEDKLKSTLEEVKKLSIEDYKKQLFSELGINQNLAVNTNTPAMDNNNADIFRDLFMSMQEALTSQLEKVSDSTSRSTSILDELLLYTRNK